jgi:fatty-acyl-CoA synthase
MMRMARAPSVTIGQVLLDAAARWPDRTAVVCDDIERTYAELATGAWTIARGLYALGVRRGDHVGVLMPNCVEMVDAIFGAALAGAVVCPVNARYRASELAYIVANADHRVLLTSDMVDEHIDYPALIADALPGLADGDPRHQRLAGAPELRQVVLIGSRGAPGMIDRRQFAQLAADVEEARVREQLAQVAVADEGLILYTSGTTARPKGCVLTHDGIVGGARSVGARERVGPTDVCWDPLPLYHTSGLQPLLYCIDAGARYCCMTHFEAGAAIDQLRREGCTIFKGTFPPVTLAVINHPGFAALDVSAVRVVQIVAPPETLRIIAAAFPNGGVQGAFGICEGGGYLSTNEPDEDLETRLRTVGPPLEGIEIRAVDPEGREVGAGEPGELLVRGFTVLRRYHRDPERTAEVLDSDGWLHTGDRGSCDERGRVTYLGRIKEMIRVGGENVAPAEIEGYLSTHPAVHMVQAVGVPDPRLDEVAAAFVELRPGAHATEQELIEFCRGQIASFKVPRHIRIVTDWPMSATKIQRFALRDRMLGELGLALEPRAAVTSTPAEVNDH